jgi:hypothetical protein
MRRRRCARPLAWAPPALINRNMRQAATDWTQSIDELQALCPNLKSVALVSLLVRR